MFGLKWDRSHMYQADSTSNPEEAQQSSLLHSVELIQGMRSKDKMSAKV